LTEAGWELVLQKAKPIAGAVTVTNAANKPDRRRRLSTGVVRSRYSPFAATLVGARPA